MLKTLYC